MITEPADRTAEPELLEIAETITAVVRGRVAPAQTISFFDTSFGILPPAIAAQEAVITGPALSRWGDASEDATELEVGFPVDRRISPDGDVVPGELPAGRVARVVHYGAFDALGVTWDRLHGWITEQGLAPGADRWEVYLTEPNPHMDPADLRTELNWSVTRR
ncbi:GyrI-like domain-containing protein [Nocardia zapadnayensis]|uniref:GyrI-like domain-containing protein n=1 Tax=Nocardia rhamnosiphila TaxID=426716 RepID=UPI002247EFFB|nr:GyrI-like domain-containing protein [Nocardia zapadnayensis]MCX0274520.1 GyrI-like domain-containing protein [Nocardia zapadnayensis]